MNNDAFAGVLRDYPFLTLVGALVGLLLLQFQQAKRLNGFDVLLAAVMIAAAVIGSYGLAQSWHAAEWHQAPFLLLLVVAFSNLSGATVGHLRDAIEPGESWTGTTGPAPDRPIEPAKL